METGQGTATARHAGEAGPAAGFPSLELGRRLAKIERQVTVLEWLSVIAAAETVAVVVLVFAC